MVEGAEVVIIGGGVIGSSIAYYLAKEGCEDVIILEREYPTWGASGRCGAGIRQQWGTEMNCRLAKGSVDLFEGLSAELDYDIEFAPGGYLVLATSQAQLEQYRRNVILQNSLGIPSKIITPQEAREIVPILRTDGLPGAAYCPTDGHANPFKTNLAFLRAAQRLGVRLYKFTEAKGIEVRGGKVRGVLTSQGRIETSKVVDAAGGYSARVGKMAGLEIPTFSERHQIMVTEPLDWLFDPMVISFTSGLYCQQVPPGSILMGMGDPDEPHSHNITSSWQFLRKMAKEVLKVLPMLREVRVVRQWAGLYNKTPDAQPILGEAERVKGFYMAVGFSGHGFMISPMVGVTLARLLMGQSSPVSVERLSLERFERGELIIEPSVVG